MSQIINKVTKKYIIIYLVYLLLNSIFPFVIMIDDTIKAIISMGLAGIGCILTIYRFIVEKQKIKTKGLYVLIVFILVMIVSMISMKQYGVLDNLKTIIWSIINFVLVYTQASFLRKDEFKEEYKKTIKILNVLWSIAILYSLYQYIFQIGYVIKHIDFSINKAQGFYYNRLFGIFIDPNYAAVTTLVLFVSTLYIAFSSKSIFNKTINFIVCFIYFTYIILSGSRTALLILFIVAAFFTFMYILKKYNKQKFTLLKGIIAVIFIVGLLFCIILLYKEGLTKVPNMMLESDKYVNNFENNVGAKKVKTDELNKTDVIEKKEEISLDRNDLSEKQNISNLRFELWEDCIKIVKGKLLFGVSPRNMISYAKENFKDTLPARGYDCGSGLLSLLVYSGITGCLIIFCFIFMVIKNIYKKLLSEIKYTKFDLVILVLLIIISIDACLNQEIFFINSVNTTVFWLVLGYIMIEKNEIKQNEKGKIGIVTIHSADNYGSALQALATQKVMENMGYNTYLIDHDCKKISAEYGIKRIFAQKNIKSIIETIIRIIILRPARANFKKFREKYYNLLEKNVNQDSIQKFVVGSDQVWNYKITGMDKDYFLDFVKDNNKKVAFSSSFGITEVPIEYRETYIELLTKFKNISVREEQAANLIENLIGKRVPVVLDPTLLMDAKQWSCIANMPYKQSGYILCYQIAHSPTLVKFAEKLSRETGKKIISVQGSLRQRFDAKYIWNAGPAEYVGLIKNADYVVTNSFHGTAFSINLNKKFFTEMLPSFEKTSSRLENILDKFNLRDRQIIDGNNDNINKEIDYTNVNKILEEERKKSLNILKSFIEN